MGSDRNMLSLIVPYRDRPDHLAQFIPHMNKYLPDASIVIVEQADDNPFNRGKLLNVGAVVTDTSHLVFHDVDMLPVNVDYTERPGITQLAGSSIQLFDYLGGVTMFERSIFVGYNNHYFHRAEDNEMMFHMKRIGVRVQYNTGIFNTLPHPRTGPEFDPQLWKLAQIPRTVNMLETCSYELVQDLQHTGYRHIKVKL